MVALLRKVLEEGAAVAAALGVELPVSIERRLRGAFAVGEHKTSMLQDFEVGKPLEIDALTGAVVEIRRPPRPRRAAPRDGRRRRARGGRGAARHPAGAKLTSSA